MATLASQKIGGRKTVPSEIENTLESADSIELSLEKTARGGAAIKDLRFALAHKLQSTLDLGEIIELFFEHTRDAVSCSGITYENLDISEQFQIGKLARHSAAYTVSSKLEKLGTVTLTRKKPFLSTELMVIELLIGALFFPLRNALLYRQAVENSMKDTLTGLGNRLAMDTHFDREVKLSIRQKTPLSVLVLDIDHFKKVNDTLGHRCGDKVLSHVSKLIQESLRETDQVFRFGGEEFVAVLNGADTESAHMTAERIRRNIESNPMAVGSESIKSTVSVGLGSLQSGDNAESLFVRADEALYKAKSNGRNCTVCSSNEFNQAAINNSDQKKGDQIAATA